MSSLAGLRPVPPESACVLWVDLGVDVGGKVCFCTLVWCLGEGFGVQPLTGERQCRRLLNCSNSSPKRFPNDVRRTGLPRLGRRRFRHVLETGGMWKYLSGSSAFSTMDGPLILNWCTGVWVVLLQGKINDTRGWVRDCTVYSRDRPLFHFNEWKKLECPRRQL